MTKVLIVEDDEHLAKILSMELSFEQYEIVVCHDGLEGLETALKGDFDLVLLDLMLPSLNGFEIARRIRIANKTVGIIMMTAKDSLTDIVFGLDSGADDYLSKPFEIVELLARMRVLLRRNQALQRSATVSSASSKTTPTSYQQLSQLDTFLDEATRTVTRGDKIVKLSKREFALLQYFMAHENQLLAREELFGAIWQKKAKGPSEINIVDVYVRYIRKKLDQNIIKTVYGKGYVYGELP